MAVKELVDKKVVVLCFWEVSWIIVLVNLGSYVSHMIQARFIVIVALHRHCIGGVANQHLTKCELRWSMYHGDTNER